MYELWTPEKPGEITVETYEAASAHPGEIFHLDFRKECGLEGIFESGMFLKDENHDFLPDRLGVKTYFRSRPYFCSDSGMQPCLSAWNGDDRNQWTDHC